VTLQPLRIPEPVDPWTTPTTPAAPAGDESWADKAGHIADSLTGWTHLVPGPVWFVFFAAAIALLPFARRQAFLAGARVTGRSKDSAKDRALFVAAMIPSAIVWVAVLAGSFKGLVAFGRDDLGWHDGFEYNVPLTLDGVGIAFAFLSFRAVKKRRSPERCLQVAQGATIASAVIQFGHEVRNGTWLGGSYLAVLSFFGLLIFHELLDQFVEGTAWIRREKPKFGLRWITWPTNTACAWVAWRNYPADMLPANAKPEEIAYWGSSKHAIAHLEDVRARKREERRQRDLQEVNLPAPWWMRAAPWVRVRQFDAALTARNAEYAEMTARLEAVIAEHEAAVAESERRAEKLAQALAEKQTAEQKAAEAWREAEKLRAETAAEMDRIRAEHTATVDRLRFSTGQQMTAARTELVEQAKRLADAEAAHIQAREEVARLGLQLSSAAAETDALRRAAERAEAEAASEVASARASAEAEVTSVRRLLEAAQAEAEAIRAASEAASVKHAEALVRIRAEAEAEVSKARAEARTVRLDDYRSGGARKTSGGSRKAATGGATKTSLTDEEAVQKCLAEHPEATFAWTQTEIVRITGCGWGRAPKLLAAVTEAASEVASGRTSGGASDLTSEQAPETTGGATDAASEVTEEVSGGAAERIAVNA
jgi:hypothetical protein